MRLVHLLQHGEAVLLRHDNVQQHQRDARSVLAQLFHALLAVGRLQNTKVVAQHLRQNGAVHGGIAHHQYLPHVRCSGLRGLPLLWHHAVGDYGVFPRLGPVHQPIRPLHRLGHSLLPRRHAADTHRHLKSLAAGNMYRLGAAADQLQRGRKVVRRYRRHQQQKLIAAVADHHARTAHRVGDHLRQPGERHVAHAVTVYVVAQLEIVQVDDGDAAAGLRVLHVQLIVVAVIRAGERVVIPLVIHILAGDQQQRPAAALHMDGIPPLLPFAAAETELEIVAVLPLLKLLPYIRFRHPCAVHIRGISAEEAQAHLLHRQPSPLVFRRTGVVVDEEPLLLPVIFRDQVTVICQRPERPVSPLHGSSLQLPPPRYAVLPPYGGVSMFYPIL